MMARQSIQSRSATASWPGLELLVDADDRSRPVPVLSSRERRIRLPLSSIDCHSDVTTRGRIVDLGALEIGAEAV